MAYSLWGSIKDWVPVNRVELRQLVEEVVEEKAGAYLRRFVGSTIAGIEGRISQLAHEQTILGERMTSIETAEAERWAKIAELVGLVKAENASLRLQVENAAADKASALGAEAEADVARLDGLIGELETALPVPVPVVPVPEPGAPAELPPAE